MEKLPQTSSEIAVASEMKLCINCNHFRGMRKHYDSTTKSGTAECFKTRDEGARSPVDGRRPSTFFECLQTRQNENQCGMEGKWYEEYKEPEHTFVIKPPPPPKPGKITADQL